MIKHTVTFKLKDNLSNADKDAFFKAIGALKKIEGIKEFDVMRRIDKNAAADYAVFVKFENMEDYHCYSSHKAHTCFIKDYWIKFVAEFNEMDFEPL